MSAPRAALLFLVAVALAGCGGGDNEADAPKSGVQNLDNVLQLRADFEADKGKTRVLVLFSPT